ncbi:MAG: hypothetical protein R2731_08055 [Nocardioides sp.]
MTSTKSKAEQRDARTAALTELKRREQRRQRVKAAAVVAVVVGMFIAVLPSPSAASAGAR